LKFSAAYVHLVPEPFKAGAFSVIVPWNRTARRETYDAPRFTTAFTRRNTGPHVLSLPPLLSSVHRNRRAAADRGVRVHDSAGHASAEVAAPVRRRLRPRQRAAAVVLRCHIRIRVPFFAGWHGTRRIGPVSWPSDDDCGGSESGSRPSRLSLRRHCSKRHRGHGWTHSAHHSG